MGHLIIIVFTIAVMVVSLLRGKELKLREMEQDDKTRTLPNGNYVFGNEVLIAMTDEEIINLAGDDVNNSNCPNIMFLINFVSYQAMAAKENERQQLRELVDRLTAIKIKTYHHGW